MPLRPSSPLGYDRPLSPTAVSRSVYRRSVPGISELVHGPTGEVTFDMPAASSVRQGTSIFADAEDQWRQSAVQPSTQKNQNDASDYYNNPESFGQQHAYLHQQQQQQQQQRQQYPGYAQFDSSQQRPYSIATSVFDEPLHQPFLTARGGISSVPVSADKRLGDLSAPLAQSTSRTDTSFGNNQSFAAQSSAQQRPLPSNDTSIGTTTAAQSTISNEKLQSAIRRVENQVGRVQRTLVEMSAQQQAYQAQIVDRQDQTLEDAYKNHKCQITWLGVIVAGLAILLLVAVVTAVYTAMREKSSTRDHRQIQKTIEMVASPPIERPGANSSLAAGRTGAQAAAPSAQVTTATVRQQPRATTDVSEGIDSDAYASQLRDQRLSSAANR